MGITYVEGKVRGPAGKSAAVRFLIDSGATYSLLPQSIWQAIDLTPKRELSFSLADGSVISRGVSECYMILAQGEAHSPVILGEAGDEALLGVVTLEILGLVFNPFNRTLQPMRLLLARYQPRNVKPPHNRPPSGSIPARSPRRKFNDRQQGTPGVG